MFVLVINILQYDRINVSEEIDIKKTSASKECDICHYWYFKDVGYKLQPYVCNGCHTVSMMLYKLKSIAISDAKVVNYSCILWGISKNDAINRLNNSVLEGKGVL